MGGGYPPHPPSARSLRSLAEDLRQMCPLRDFAPPKLSAPGAPVRENAGDRHHKLSLTRMVASVHIIIIKGKKTDDLKKKVHVCA